MPQNKRDFSHYRERMDEAVRSAATQMREKRYYLLKGSFSHVQGMLESLEKHGMDAESVMAYKRLMNRIYDRNPEKCAELGLKRYPTD
ncbi:MAG: hypothetical protein HYW27_02020 [Candidatus Aenigmarchaeota archaeon]|nr:hypothetical protein [Candidatus Aenigmarchaeota archaeon]